MFRHLDQVLRQMLIREMPIEKNEVAISFDQPKREWSAKLNRPTLNLFLYDVRENRHLRQTRPAWEEISRNGDKSVTRRRRPVRLDLFYMLSAWTTSPEDEHRLLARTLMALFRLPNIPEDLLPEALQDQPVPIILMADQDDQFRNPAEIWSALDNEMRPAIPLVVTVAMNPYEPVTDPLVHEFEVQFGSMMEPG